MAGRPKIHNVGGGRVCTLCKEWKPALAFQKRSSTDNGIEFTPLRSRCRNCMLKLCTDKKKAYYLVNKARVIANHIKWKKSNPERAKELERRYHFNNAEAFCSRERSNYLRRKFGLLKAEWESLFLFQGGKCAICHITNPTRKRRKDSTYAGEPNVWHTDHDHRTGLVRGILCHICNTKILGCLESYPGFLLPTPIVQAYLDNPPFNLWRESFRKVA